MRLAFVHGIKNEDNDADSIREEWWAALVEGWQAQGLVPRPRPTIDVGYYGKLLDEGLPSGVAEMGPGDTATATGYSAGLLREYAAAAGLTQTELDAAAAELGVEPEVVAQGIPFQGAIVKFASVLERALPTKGKILSRVLLAQAIRYINDEALAAAVDRDVRRQIFDGKGDPVIVVSHSLGTVVSYRLLAADSQAQRKVPLFVTLGSPLSVRMFRSILPARGSLPTPPIGEWLNARNAEDFVTLGRPIDADSIGFGGVIDHPDVQSDALNVHNIRDYLRDPVVAKKIYGALA